MITRPIGYGTCPVCEDWYDLDMPCPCRLRQDSYPRWLPLLTWSTIFACGGLAWAGMAMLVSWAVRLIGGL